MVVFGAGASYDSFGALTPPNPKQYRMPLANELFDLRFGDDYRLFPQCHPVIPLLQRSGVNVESVLEGLQQDAKQYSPGLVQLAAIRYYLGYMLSRCQETWTDTVTKGVTNYKTLLDQIARRAIGKEKVCLVTFNYDTLLDEALTSRGVKLQSMLDYIRSDFYLIKLHGSVNWAHEVRNYPIKNGDLSVLIPEIIDNAPNLDVNSDSFELANANPFNRPFGKPLFPALAIPVENKPGYECPQDHQKVLKEFFPQITKVLLIGWRANENRFLNDLATNMSKRVSVMVVSRDQTSASQTLTRISPVMGKNGVIMNNFFAAKTSFSGFVFSSELTEFLQN